MKMPINFSTGDPSYFVVATTSGNESPTVLTISKELVTRRRTENRLGKHSAARLQIAVNVLRPRRILLPVRELIAVGLQDQISR